MPGSSPLVRGGLADLARAGSGDRLIPARAGRTSDLGCLRGLHSAHPRSCGADSGTRHAPSACRGSSPLVRGGPESVAAHVCKHRLIPARAGRTWSARIPTGTRSAHPRSCGADHTGRAAIATLSGSSPLVRGGRDRSRRRRPDRRLIPARAGRTPPKWPASAPTPAHPRSCGADLISVSVRVVAAGSSPLVRGGPVPLLGHHPRERLIPARAGRTCGGRAGRGCSAAHPRSCGADGSLRDRDGDACGSSPLVRGGPRPGGDRSAGRRLIPARAGRTYRGAAAHPPTGAHPRSCGADPPSPR